MKWEINKPKVKEGDTRTIRAFAWLPVRLDDNDGNLVCWLGLYEKEQIYQQIYYPGHYQYKWVTVKRNGLYWTY